MFRIYLQGGGLVAVVDCDSVLAQRIAREIEAYAGESAYIQRDHSKPESLVSIA